MLTGKVISFQNGRDNFLRSNGWQNCGGRRFPNKWISANHSDSRIPAVNRDGKIKSGDNCANAQRVPSLEQIVARSLRRKDLTREHTGHSFMNSKLFLKILYVERLPVQTGTNFFWKFFFLKFVFSSEFKTDDLEIMLVSLGKKQMMIWLERNFLTK